MDPNLQSGAPNPGFDSFLSELRSKGKRGFWSRKPLRACEMCDYESDEFKRCPNCHSKIRLKILLLQDEMEILRKGWLKFVGKDSSAMHDYRLFLSEIGVKRMEYGYRVI
jgi:hypothetical protein